MKLTIDLENLEQLVETVLEENLNAVIESEISNIIASNVKSNAREIIENTVHEKLESYVNDYIKTATVSVGGGWNSEPVTYTVEEYIKQQISEVFRSGKLKTKNRYGEY